MSDGPSPVNASRRTFLKGSTATAIGGVMSTPFASRTYAAGSDEIRVALVGCGGRGTGAIHDALQASGNIKLVAMADAFGGRLESSYERIKTSRPEQVDVPESRRFVGLDAYKQAIDTDCNLVLNTTPPGFRPLHFEYAIKAGKNAFLEKPVAVDAPGIKRVQAAAKLADEKGLKVAVGFQLRHHLPFQETIKRVHDGEIGDIVYLRAYRNSAGLWMRQRQPNQTEMEYQVNNWYYFNWLGGDHIVEQHVHNHDLISWVMHDTYPLMAQGMGGRQVRTGKDYGEIFDHHAVESTYENDIRLICECRHIRNVWNRNGCVVYGTKGYADINGSSIETRDGRRWRYRGETPSNRHMQHEALTEAIRNDLPFNEAHRGAMSSMVSILARNATYSGQVVRMRDAMERGKELAPGIDHYTFDTEPPTLPDENGLYPIPMPGQTEVLVPA